MIQLSSYFIGLFTFQVIMITQRAPSWYFPLLWGMLVVLIWKIRPHLQYPADHPHASVQRKKVRYMLLFLVILFISYYYLAFSVHAEYRAYKQSPLHQFVNQNAPIQVSGTFRSVPEQDGNRTRFDLLVTTVNKAPLTHPQIIRISYYAEFKEEMLPFEQIQKGDLWLGNIEIRYPQAARNPGAFDYQKFLRTQHIYFIGHLTSPAWKTVASERLLDRFLAQLDKQRKTWIEQTSNVFSPDVATIVQAMSVGYRQDLDSALVEMYQQLGIIHILAISGLHVGIVIYGMYTLLKKLPLTHEKIIWILWWMIPLYMYISGAQASVIRAGVMAMLALLLQRYKLWKHSLLLLYCVYVLGLLHDPLNIFQVGFQLSYFVTFMLIVAYKPVCEWLNRFIRWDKLNQLLAISLVAQIAVLPFLVYHFHLFSPISLFVNLLVVPLYSVILIPGGYLLTLASFIHKDFVQLGALIYELIFSYLHVLLEKLYAVPWVTLHFGQPAAWWIMVYVAVMILWLVCIERQKWRAVWLTLAGLILWMGFQLSLPYLDYRAHIMVLDVGQGDAIVIELPYRKEVILIDVGGNASFGQEEWMKRKNEYEVGRHTVLPYLRYRGIQQVDKLIFSHGHYDHIGGIQGLFGQVQIKQVLKGPVLPISNFEAEWLDKMDESDIPIQALGRGDRWGTKQAEFHVLYPQQKAAWVEVGDSPHDHNVVIWNRIYQHRFLWTGDIEELGEMEMLAYDPELKADILKVAHHGSNTSTTEEFIEQLQPKVGLLSVGEQNVYGHPHREVVQRLEQNDVTLFRTDLHGGLYLIVSPSNVRVKPTLHFSGK